MGFIVLDVDILRPGLLKMACFGVLRVDIRHLLRRERFLKELESLWFFGSVLFGGLPVRKMVRAQKGCNEYWDWAAMKQRGRGSISFVEPWSGLDVTAFLV